MIHRGASLLKNKVVKVYNALQGFLVLVLDGNSEHVAHVRRKISIFFATVD